MSFTRSTTDLKVHQSLSDYPNVEDGLSAEELKKKFDAPAEQLQKDLNKLEEELELRTGAANIGAEQLTDGDDTNPNIQDKLSYLLREIQQTALGQIPDGSITKNKIEDEYARTLAEKTGDLQEGLNAEKINGKTDIELHRSMIKVGIYTGTSNESQTIDVGFKPSAVIISGTNNLYIDATRTPSRNYIGIIGESGLNEEYYTSGGSYVAEPHELTDNGFIVNKLKRTMSNEIQYLEEGLNAENVVYTYIAFR